MSAPRSAWTPAVRASPGLGKRSLATGSQLTREVYCPQYYIISTLLIYLLIFFPDQQNFVLIIKSIKISVQEVDFTAEIELDPSICGLLASDQRVSFVLSVFGQSSSKLTVELGTVFYLLLLANTSSQS